MQNSIVLLTDGKTLKFTNKTFLDFFGYKDMAHFKEDYRCVCDRFIEHDNFFHLGKQQPGEAHWIESLLNLSGRQRVVSMINKDAVPHAFSVSINLFDTNDYVVNFTDISDTMVEKLELTKEATVDMLTGVYNRIYFNKHIKEILEAHHNKAMQTGVIFFDIDHFKKVNDTFGHDVGDMVLKTVALLATRHTRDDDKVIRWGGEEFIIICEIDAVKSLYKIAEHLRSVVEHHAFKEVGSVTCSFGCAAHDSNDKIMNTLKKADEKLYEAKNNGRNRVECV
jgi:diguanylate cyclase (GGDEF)-like protein